MVKSFIISSQNGQTLIISLSLSLHKKWRLPLRSSSVIWPNPEETSDLVTFTEEILNGKLHFLCSVCCNIFRLSLTILGCYVLTLSWRRSLSCRNHLIDLQNKSLDWFPFDRDFRHEMVKGLIKSVILFLQGVPRIPWDWNYFIINSTWKFYSKLLWNNWEIRHHWY